MFIDSVFISSEMEKDIWKVLLVDDDEDDYIVTEELLADAERSQFKLDWVETYEAALEAIEQDRHDVYLFDYRLGKDNGLELLREALKLGCQKPIVLLTGLGDHDIDWEAMKIGAEDYLVKGQIDTPLLERAILHAIERKRSEAKQAQLLRELKTVNRELKDFAYIVSHDLKAPLRGIGSLVKWLATDYADRLDEEGQEMLELLEGRVKRLHNLIDGILQYSRVGRLREEQVEVDLNQIVAEAIDAIAPPEKIKIAVESDLPVILCERTRIQQVFQNLLSNAVKYMDKPQGEIKISCAASNHDWKFAVADNGPGIEAKHFEKIFQIFQTLSPRDDFESTGVGLTLVKKIIEMYDGRIWVESKVGQGSTFFFTLPKPKKIHKPS